MFYALFIVLGGLWASAVVMAMKSTFGPPDEPTE